MLAPYQARSSLNTAQVFGGLAPAMLKTNSQGIALVTAIAVVSALLLLSAVAVLYYAAMLQQNLTYGILALLIFALVYLLYRFNERRLQEIRLAEAERRQHVEEMATIHMNTIESL